MGRLEVAFDLLTEAVEQRRQGDPAPDDPFRGLYLSDEAVAWLVDRPAPLRLGEWVEARLAEVEASAAEQEEAGHDVRLRRLARTFGLTDTDVHVLCMALLPEVDSRAEQLIGYLNDDVTRKRPSLGLVLQLCGVPVASGAARARFAPSSPLVSGGLVVIEDSDRPFPGRALRVPDRVVAHLLGDETPEPGVADLIDSSPPRMRFPMAERLGASIRSGTSLVCIRDSSGGPGRALAADALARAGLGSMVIRLDRIVAAAERVAVVDSLLREARLTRAGIVAELPAGAGDEALEGVLRDLTGTAVPVMVVTSSSWDPSWSAAPPLLIDAPDFPAFDRAELWRELLGEVDQGTLDATIPFVLSPDGVQRAARSARHEASFDQTGLTAGHVRRGARLQNAAGLERLARRIEPTVGWDDLVLPASLVHQLHEIALRARHRDRVLGEWRMRPGGGRGRGVTALFAGDSGTGKTMSAEVIARDLGLDLYTVDLATVVDKYVGETEKNLERIFSEAAGVNGVLLFDEADAVFGKRSEVKDAHDRYANIESAYLLQRMESFDGLAILATNLRANLDDAFTRRLDLVLDFPNPDVDQRRSLWDRCLGDALPRDDDLDLDFCAQSFDLTGGSIRSIAVTAAYLAADSDERITMRHLIDAVQREFRKLGRLVLGPAFQER